MSKLRDQALQMAGMDWLAIMQVLFGFGFVLYHVFTGAMDGNVWLTGYSMAFGGVSTKLGYETVNPRLTRPTGPTQLGPIRTAMRALGSKDQA